MQTNARAPATQQSHYESFDPVIMDIQQVKSKDDLEADAHGLDDLKGELMQNAETKNTEMIEAINDKDEVLERARRTLDDANQLEQEATELHRELSRQQDEINRQHREMETRVQAMKIQVDDDNAALSATLTIVDDKVAVHAETRQDFVDANRNLAVSNWLKSGSGESYYASMPIDGVRQHLLKQSTPRTIEEYTTVSFQ